LGSAVIAAVAAGFGIAQNYGYLRASILTGSLGGYYHSLATRLGERAKRGNGTLTIVPTAGSIENVSRLTGGRGHCAEMFALIQDGTPVPADAQIALLGRLPELESLVLLGRANNAFRSFANRRGASIGIGPEGSGTAHLMRQLFEDADLRRLDVRFSHHSLAEQAELVGQGKLDLAAFVMQEDAEFLHQAIQQHGLDIVAPQDFEGLVARYPWLSLGRIPAGRYDLVRPTPAVDKQVARLATLVVANRCAWRADRIALLVLLGEELPGFVRGNPPRATSAATIVPPTAEAQQFFLTGEPALADRYFPWLVNLLSPAYWIYLAMAVTVLFNGMTAFSRFRLWRIDVAREKLEATLKELVDQKLTHAQIRGAPIDCLARPDQRTEARSILQRFLALRLRCQRYTNSFVTPMGDEMFYRYQQFLIDDATTALSALLKRSEAGKPLRG
jgi:TRAP-type uncharacterized transport system substrate-binding protein